MTSIKRAFTLVELITVCAIIMLILAGLVTTAQGARERACIQKATSEVKTITQAVLGYENYKRNGGYELPLLDDVDCDLDHVGFIFGKEDRADDAGMKIPATLMAQLKSAKAMRDPWGTPYKIKIKKASTDVRYESAVGDIKSGYMLPNIYRLSPEERR